MTPQVHMIYVTTTRSVIHRGSVSAPFTGTAYRVTYFKHISKDINYDTMQVRIYDVYPYLYFEVF